MLNKQAQVEQLHAPAYYLKHMRGRMQLGPRVFIAFIGVISSNLTCNAQHVNLLLTTCRVAHHRAAYLAGQLL